MIDAISNDTLQTGGPEARDDVAALYIISKVAYGTWEIVNTKTGQSTGCLYMSLYAAESQCRELNFTYAPVQGDDTL